MAKEYPYYYKRMRERKWNKETFDTDKLFEELDYVLAKKCHIYPDDLKGNIWCSEYWEDKEFVVCCHLSWIFYTEDIPKHAFKYKAKDIEEELATLYRIYEVCAGYNCGEVECLRFDDSRYENSPNAYDVDLKLKMTFRLKETDIWKI